MATNKNITMKQFNGTDYDTLYPKTIASQVDGVLPAQILVIMLPNTEVIASLNGRTVNATSDSSGLATLEIPSYGTWTVTVGSVSKTINIDAVAVFYLAMPGIESLSWSQVATISKMGLASATFHIGDEKTLTVNGVSYTAVIIGFDHDTPTDRTAYGRDKAGITWQLKNCLNTAYSMNSSSTNANGWEGCHMRNTTLNSTIYEQLNSDLKAVIKDVNKVTSVGNNITSLETTSDKLFLLSEIEIFGSVSLSLGGEGKQYEYYRAGNPALKTVNGSAQNWWERSPRMGTTTAFCSVSKNGNKSDDPAILGSGVSFAFCV